MKNDEVNLRRIISEKYSKKIVKLTEVGQGAVGKVYLVELENDTRKFAVKYTAHKSLMEYEVNSIEFISSKVDFKLPKIYSTYSDDSVNIIIMEYIDGINANNYKFTKVSKEMKTRFANEVIDNLLRLQEVKHNKFGEAYNPSFDSWNQYYKPFAKYALDTAEIGNKKKEIPYSVYKLMNTAYELFDSIFDEQPEYGVLSHGDYWLPNIIVDKDTMELLGVVDPFNIMYADKEYDLFPLIAANGNKFNLLDTYKSKMVTTKKCDLKLEFYALFSEIFWYSKTGKVYKGFIKHKSKLLKKQLKRFGYNTK